MARVSNLELVGLAGVLLWSSAGVALARCGSDPRDSAAVAAVESAATAQCDCCSVTGASPRHVCVVRAVKKSVRDGTLPRRCASKSVRDMARACPLAADVPCRLCQSDADCQANQICDCVAGTCGHAGGVCTTRPDVCSDIVAPVCGCDGTTYANDCFRRQAGACRRHDGPCAETGGCADPTGQCTCFDLVAAKCTHQSCGAAHPCLPNQACVSSCPPPPPSGRCFVTVDMQCSDEPCDAAHPCRNPNEFCSAACPSSTTTTLPGCQSDADCDDHNGCSVDRCVDGTCQYVCVCVDPVGSATCCPGPAALCAHPTTTTIPCIPFFESGCSATSDCCEPCIPGRVPPCAVCLQGTCAGAP